MRISGFGLRQAEVQYLVKHDTCMVRVSVGRSDGCHEADSPFHAIPKFSRILNVSAVLTMSINKGVNEAHHHDPILEASQEHLSDQVMEKMASPWKHRSAFPNRGKHIVQERTLVVKRETESRAHPENQLDTFVLHLQCETFEPCIARCKGCAENVSPGREARDGSFMRGRMSAIR